MNTELYQRLLLPPGRERILCAVSGGADSMCLLQLLYANREALGIRVFAAHYEHGIRGEESLQDAAFVREVCERLQIPLMVEHGDVPGYAVAHGMGLEEAARLLRYSFLEKSADELACDAIATAHNADDNAETMLFHLARGSGLKGLGGIPPQRGNIIRPLLTVTRAEIEAYLKENRIPFREDSSNANEAYSRNRIRHSVMPELKTLNPAAVSAMSRTARLLRQDEDCLCKMAQSFISTQKEGQVSSEALNGLHPALAGRVLRLMCPEELEEKHVNALLKLTEGTELAFCDVPGLRVRREQGSLFFLMEKEKRIQPRRLLPDGAELPEAGLRLKVRKTVYTGEIHDLFKTYWIKCESICGTLRCSSRMPGDRIHPQGRNCGKSLKAIFRENKLTQQQRDLCPVIRDDQGVLIVLGYAVDERCVPKPGDEAVCIELERLE